MEPSKRAGPTGDRVHFPFSVAKLYRVLFSQGSSGLLPAEKYYAPQNIRRNDGTLMSRTEQYLGPTTLSRAVSAGRRRHGESFWGFQILEGAKLGRGLGILHQ